MTLLFSELRRTEVRCDGETMHITQLNPVTKEFENVYLPMDAVDAFLGFIGDEAAKHRERRV